MNRKPKFDLWTLVMFGLLGLYGVFLIYPMMNLLAQAVIDKETGAFTLAYFVEFFSTPYYFNTLLNSFKVTFWVTILTVIIATPLAYIFARYEIKGKGLLRILIILSSMSAPFIGAYSWILLLGRNGVITQFFNKTIGITIPNIYGFVGILLVLTLQLYPLIFLYVSGALKNVDNSLLEASENLGVSGVRRFFIIVIPLITPTLLAGGLLVFMRALADFGTPMLIGEGFRTFPVTIFNEFISEIGGDDGFAAAISIVAIIITTFVFLTQKYLSSRKTFTMTVLNKIRPEKTTGIKNFLIHAYAYTLVSISIMPQLYIFYTSFKNTKGLTFAPGYSLQSYYDAFDKVGKAVVNTITIPAVSLVFIVFLAVLLAYISVRRSGVFSNILDSISMVPYIIPGSVVGIALLIAFNKPPILLSGTMVIMVVGLVIRRLPYTIRSSAAILQQIPISIEEAALSLGSSKLNTFYKITMPMMAAGIVSGAILSWITMISELSTAILLYTGRTQTLTVAIYTQIIRGNYGISAALSTILAVLTVTSLLIFNKVSKGGDLSL
ncbi:MAG: iron ABC transporter permease [Anaerolineae bacterium]|jgi:iron(III) transport system permease protein|nr:iron ABC transporter permease [Anaerolineae bacterium]MBT6059823.1 iron ABC transporter permease [Anaerolineae bacterium]MBT6322670.1 iron ABC transporter permease [Anaerolineae bacterium]MBT6812167.1 iron ABC transporter permease [Anaerolineae bacterium]